MATGQGARRLKRESADFDVSDGGAGRGWQGAGSLVESRGGGARCGYPTADARGVSAPPCASAISALGAGSRVMAVQNTESSRLSITSSTIPSAARRAPAACCHRCGRHCRLSHDGESDHFSHPQHPSRAGSQPSQSKQSRRRDGRCRRRSAWAIRQLPTAPHVPCLPSTTVTTQAKLSSRGQALPLAERPRAMVWVSLIIFVQAQRQRFTEIHNIRMNIGAHY